jgi:hypothetical protein
MGSALINRYRRPSKCPQGGRCRGLGWGHVRGQTQSKLRSRRACQTTNEIKLLKASLKPKPAARDGLPVFVGPDATELMPCASAPGLSRKSTMPPASKSLREVLFVSSQPKRRYGSGHKLA